MSLKHAPSQSCLDSEIRFSYFVKKKAGKPSRIGLARVLDISETGVCMEISPLDSDLFVESCAAPLAFNLDIELQIYCRSHPRNIFLEGTVRWFKPKGDLSRSRRPHQHSSDGLGICAGVVFSVDDPEKRREIEQMLGCIESTTTSCRECGSPVSANGSFCYECGARITSRRDALRTILNSVLANGVLDFDIRDIGGLDSNV